MKERKKLQGIKIQDKGIQSEYKLKRIGRNVIEGEDAYEEKKEKKKEDRKRK